MIGIVILLLAIMAGGGVAAWRSVKGEQLYSELRNQRVDSVDKLLERGDRWRDLYWWRRANDNGWKERLP